MNYAESASAGTLRDAQRTPPPVAAPVHAAQQQLVSEIDSLHSVIENLYERLGPVLAPPTPSKESSKNIAQADVTVSQKIDAAARTVRAATDRLIEIRARLEI